MADIITTRSNPDDAENPPAEPVKVAGEDVSSRSAIRDTLSHLRLWPVAVIGLVLDLGSKYWAFTQLDPDPDAKQIVIPYLMSFQRSLNTGALFGLGKGLTVVFIAASILALAFVLFLFAHSTRDRRSLHIALGLVLAGALGNMYDRVFVVADVIRFTNDGEQVMVVRKVIEELPDGGYIVGSWPEGEKRHPIPADWKPIRTQQGVVRDFIRMEPSITIGSFSFDVWPWIFNLADVWLVVGVGLLMLNFWWDRKAERAAKSSASAEPAPDG